MFNSAVTTNDGIRVVPKTASSVLLLETTAVARYSQHRHLVLGAPEPTKLLVATHCLRRARWNVRQSALLLPRATHYEQEENTRVLVQESGIATT